MPEDLGDLLGDDRLKQSIHEQLETKRQELTLDIANPLSAIKLSQVDQFLHTIDTIPPADFLSYLGHSLDPEALPLNPLSSLKKFVDPTKYTDIAKAAQELSATQQAAIVELLKAKIYFDSFQEWQSFALTSQTAAQTTSSQEDKKLTQVHEMELYGPILPHHLTETQATAKKIAEKRHRLAQQTDEAEKKAKDIFDAVKTIVADNYALLGASSTPIDIHEFSSRIDQIAIRDLLAKTIPLDPSSEEFKALVEEAIKKAEAFHQQLKQAEELRSKIQQKFPLYPTIPQESPSAVIAHQIESENEKAVSAQEKARRTNLQRRHGALPSSPLPFVNLLLNEARFAWHIITKKAHPTAEIKKKTVANELESIRTQRSLEIKAMNELDKKLHGAYDPSRPQLHSLSSIRKEIHKHRKILPKNFTDYSETIDFPEIESVEVVFDHLVTLRREFFTDTGELDETLPGWNPPQAEYHLGKKSARIFSALLYFDIAGNNHELSRQRVESLLKTLTQRTEKIIDRLEVVNFVTQLISLTGKKDPILAKENQDILDRIIINNFIGESRGLSALAMKSKCQFGKRSDRIYWIMRGIDDYLVQHPQESYATIKQKINSPFL